MTVLVSDHAVLRWLERVHGVDVEFFRRQVAAKVARGVALGASAVTVDGATYCLRGIAVVTVLTKAQRPRLPRGGMWLDEDFLASRREAAE